LIVGTLLAGPSQQIRDVNATSLDHRAPRCGSRRYRRRVVDQILDKFRIDVVGGHQQALLAIHSKICGNSAPQRRAAVALIATG
jgi:hypothetical protein